MAPPPSAPARYAAYTAARQGVSLTLLDADGYLFRAERGGRAFVFGVGSCTPYLQNTSTAHAIARDKAHSHAVLASAGAPVIDTWLYFLSGRYASWRGPGRERADALRRAAEYGRPLFVKPNAGSHGDFARAINSPTDLEAYMADLPAAYEAIVLQPFVEGEEHRVFVLEGRALFSYRKAADGPGPRNRAAGGRHVGFTTEVPPGLARIALETAEAVGLRAAGVDVFDRSPGRDLSDLVIIEANANPGIETLEDVGRWDLIETIWASIFDAGLGRGRP